jgi:predicted amidohydrolase YtcJ
MLRLRLFTLLFSLSLLLPTWALPQPAHIPEAPDESLPARPLANTKGAQRKSNDPVTIFTAKKILTMDPMQPEATAVAVQDGHILAVGSLADVKGWAGKSPVTVDDQFANATILPGFIEAHMHIQITGLLWEGVYVGRFDRYTPDGKFEKGLKSKQEVLDKLAAAAKALGDNEKWLIAWGYQPEFYNNAPLQVSDLDPISGKHPMMIENASMHIYYVNGKALKIGDIKASDNIRGVMVENGKLTGEFQEIDAIKRLLPKLPPVDDALLLKGTWNAAKLAHQVGVTTIGDASFGTIPGSYKAFKAASESPDYPVRILLNPVLDVIQSPRIQELGGLDYIKELMKANNDRLFVGAVKFMTDGSVQGLTANLNWPYYHLTGQNGVANMKYEDIVKWVGLVHKAGLQCMIHTNADQATQWAIEAIQKAQDEHPRFDHRHHLDHNQMVTENQLQRMATLGIATNLFINHVHFWGDLHVDIIGPNRAAKMNPLKSALRHGVQFSTHSDGSVTRLDPLMSTWIAATRKTMSGKVLGPNERITVEEALRMQTMGAAYLMFKDDVLGSITPGKLADFAILAENPLDVPVDHVKDIKVLGTVMGGRLFPTQ